MAKRKNICYLTITTTFPGSVAVVNNCNGPYKNAKRLLAEQIDQHDHERGSLIGPLRIALEVHDKEIEYRITHPKK